MVWIRWEALGFVYLKLTIYQDERNYSGQTQKRLYQVSEGLELIIALVAVVGVVIAAVNLFPELLVYWQNRTNGEAFLIFLDAVFDVVIGGRVYQDALQTKFTEYHGGFDLSDCPSYDRTETSALEDLLSVVSIGILFFFRRFMLATKPDKEQHVPELLGAIRHSGNKQEKETKDNEQ